MQVSAIAKRLQISPQKVRLVADQVRGKPVADALDILNFSTRKGALLVRKTVESAIALAAARVAGFGRGSDASPSSSAPPRHPNFTRKAGAPKGLDPTQN